MKIAEAAKEAVAALGDKLSKDDAVVLAEAVRRVVTIQAKESAGEEITELERQYASVATLECLAIAKLYLDDAVRTTWRIIGEHAVKSLPAFIAAL